MSTAPQSIAPVHRAPLDAGKEFLRTPFRQATWRRVAYLLLAPFVGVLCLLLALVGGPAGRIQRSVARTLLGVQAGEPERTGPLALAHAVISLPLNFVAAVVTVYGWSIVPMNLGWPLRPLIGMSADPTDAWGGPTLAGAWALHAVGGGIGFMLLMPWICRGLTALQGKLVVSLLGGRRTGYGWITGLALLVAAAGAALAVPVIHQL
ncbi:sensor domain-containing protein [Streptomyces sp. MST-110588]|uniref:sensor domain-containing protein n=1 Tax=Streptomyces sp. MST-110588 TaxID=2833628 RepID=UPI001F5C5AC2|nr:sensor domain-containing protein [Streptomyces sp. MST-110588]UNO42102.1 hypothetical protein KGS77_24535 [Streptomyces sp. MST-110588]